MPVFSCRSHRVCCYDGSPKRWYRPWLEVIPSYIVSCMAAHRPQHLKSGIHCLGYKSPFSDGVTHLNRSPLTTFLQRLMHRFPLIPAIFSYDSHTQGWTGSRTSLHPALWRYARCTMPPKYSTRDTFREHGIHSQLSGRTNRAVSVWNT
jgi:hypothetical protein